MPAWSRVAVLACLSCLLLGGCRDKQKQRSGVQFHARGVRDAIGRLRKEVDGTGAGGQADLYAMENATAALGRALRGLPGRVEKTAQTRQQERKDAAEKARQLFEGYRPTLESLRYDKAEANAKLDELDRLIQEVEKS